jgi:hypothetical protein
MSDPEKKDDGETSKNIKKHQNDTVCYRLCDYMDSASISYWCANEDVRKVKIPPKIHKWLGVGIRS